MNTKLFYILFSFFLLFLGASCTSDDEADLEKQEENIAELVDTFFYNLLSYEFVATKEMVTKSSYSSLDFLNKASMDFLQLNLIKVDSCVIDGKKASCLCEFEYYGGDVVSKRINLGKYDDEWLIDFQVGKNFDNIFIYNYGYSLNRKWKDLDQIELDTIAATEIKKVLSRMKSGMMKLGFSSFDEIKSVDDGYEGNYSYGSSVSDVSGLRITSTYTFYEERLETFVVNIENSGEETDVNIFAQSISRLFTDVLGAPFNVPTDQMQKMHELKELRWFIKSYNEILILTFEGDHFSLIINEIP